MHYKHFFSKRIIIIILPLLFITDLLVAQSPHPIDTVDLNKKDLWKINLQLISLGGSFEKAIAKQTTLNFELDLSYAFSYSSSGFYGGNHWAYIFSPSVSTEMRQYYGNMRRVLKHKTLRNNSGNFWSFTAGFKPSPIYSYHYEDTPVFYLVPAWGMQRSWGKHINLEGRFGWALKYGTRDVTWSGSPNIRLGIGYVIR